MRILLINPYYPISETPSPPLGLSYLAGALEQNDIEVRILDLVVYPYSKQALQTLLDEFQPQIVGATSVTMNFYDAQKAIRDVKAICPEIVTVMGGPHVTFCAHDTLSSFPELDIVVLGEGENTIVSIAKEALNNKKWSSIPGIVYRDGSEIKSTGGRPGPIHGHALPMPARHLIPLGRYRALGMPITMTTSRGCPFHCIFCVGRKLLGPKVRMRRPEDVLNELEQISMLNFPQINIADDLFTGNKTHCLSVCNGIIKRKLKLPWTAFARVDTVTHEILEKMKQAGCHTVSFGVESGNKNILKTIKKGITPQQVISAVKACNEVGINPHASFILGLPGETPETLRETIEFSKKLKDMGVAFGFHLLAPFPGTEVRERADELGIKILTNDWSQYHANKAITETNSVSKAILDNIVKEWESDFHKWLGEISDRIDKGIATNDEKEQYEKLEHAAILYELMMDSTIEKLGRWTKGSLPLSHDELLSDLSNRVNGATRHSPDSLYRALLRAYKRNEIAFITHGGDIHCTWVDYL